MDETPEGSAEPENPPTLSTNVTVQSKRWLVEGSAPGNASPRRQSYASVILKNGYASKRKL
ncbi:hypothetical protein B5C00_04990 [Staphylococcus delphini]|nr:hypothetical protein B5C00_04990 [Staphylococcus delphini]